MSLIAALLLAQVSVGPPDPALPPGDPAATFALFRRLCFEPFPDPAAFEAAIAAEGSRFVRWRPSTQVEGLIPGQVWLSGMATVRYSSENPHADSRNSVLRDLPTPQCTIKASAASATDAEQLFPALASTLGLGQGRISGRRTYRTAMWDLPRASQRWRVILGTERMDDRLVLKLSMLNLRTDPE